ncbi:hypothetical protein KCP76_25285 [Salmonella enterica subsp. enterica serovar Weltevreden]|nr:hypothetical protein KCP76_25285 [Salmonella enterica subsp. enterica serovar Weltevreden]
MMRLPFASKASPEQPEPESLYVSPRAAHRFTCPAFPVWLCAPVGSAPDFDSCLLPSRGENLKRYLRRIICRHRLPARHLFNHHIRQPQSLPAVISAGRSAGHTCCIQTRLIAAEHKPSLGKASRILFASSARHPST